MFREKTVRHAATLSPQTTGTRKQPLIKTEMRGERTSENEAHFHADTTSRKLYL